MLYSGMSSRVNIARAIQVIAQDETLRTLTCADRVAHLTAAGLTSVRGLPLTKSLYYTYANPAPVREGARRRRERLRQARHIATHTPAEWQIILDRAAGRCTLCGKQRPLTKDHIRPLHDGGDDSASNLRALCRSCNSGIGNGGHTFRYKVRDLRHALAENVGAFGARFDVSGRTVEDWEQGRRTPFGVTRRLIVRLLQSHNTA